MIDQVIRDAFVAMDEHVTEAAAATVAVMTVTSAPAISPVPVILDGPFLYRIIDETSGARFSVGQITDRTNSTHPPADPDQPVSLDRSLSAHRMPPNGCN